MARLLAHNVEGSCFKTQARPRTCSHQTRHSGTTRPCPDSRGLTEQKQTKENATFELKRFSNRSFSKRSQRAQSTQGSKGHARFNLQSQEGKSANQQRVKRSSSFFAPPVPIVTIVAAGVLPAGHRGLPVGAWPQSTFGATVTTQLSQVYVWHSDGI